MKNLKYFIPMVGGLLSRNPYQTKYIGVYKPTKTQFIYDLYQIITSIGLLYLLSLLIKH
jgi:hypothetical protein